MDRNTKLLTVITFIFVIGVFTLLWFGTRSNGSIAQVRIQQSAESATKSASTSAILGANEQLVLVTKVIDGDTIEIAGGQHVRIIGVDTPETVDPKRPVGCFGKEASNEVKSLLTGKQVILEADVEDQDKYKRLLRYVYLPLPEGKLFIDDYLIREGFGKVLNIPPDMRYADRFTAAQTEARAAKKGLWGKCS